MFHLPGKDIEAIEQIHRRWIEAELSGNVLEVLRFCTDDVRWMVPGSEVLVGKEAASLLVHNGTEIVDIQTAAVEIRGSCDIAYKTCKYTTRFVAEGTDSQQVARGSHLWILHKQDTEEWKVALVTWQPSSGI
jgi:ketosteroid isomerase-like protein